LFHTNLQLVCYLCLRFWLHITNKSLELIFIFKILIFEVIACHIVLQLAACCPHVHQWLESESVVWAVTAEYISHALSFVVHW
jgi:hypothetical protein